MPQPNRHERFLFPMDTPKDFRGNADTDTPEGGPWSQPFGCNSQHHLFPTLLNPHASQRNVSGWMGLMVPPGSGPELTAWNRPLRHFAPQPALGRGEKPALNPFATESATLPWQRTRADTNQPTSMPECFPQPGNNPNTNLKELSHTRGDYSQNPNKIEKAMTDTALDKGEGGNHNDQNTSTTNLPHSSTKSGDQGTPVTPANGTPPRKDRSSSGPKTPPGLKCDISFGSITGIEGKYNLHSLLLANIPLKLAGEEDCAEDPFDDESGESAWKSKPTFTRTGKSVEVGVIKPGLGTNGALKNLPATQSVTDLSKDKSDGVGTEAQNINIVSLSNIHAVTRDRMALANSMRLHKSNEYMDDGKSKPVTRHSEDLKNIKDQFGSSKILQIDANNNNPWQSDANIQEDSNERVPNLQEKVPLKTVRNPNAGSETKKEAHKSPPVAFVSPFQYPAYQPKPDSARRGRKGMTLTTGLSARETMCPKCHDRLRWPHLLVCCHRMCFPCLAALFDNEKLRIQCPYCRSITYTQKSLTSLTLDLQRCREMCSLQVSPFVCTLCAGNKHADTLCDTCPAFLCCDCRIKHRTDPDLASHVLGPVKNVGYTDDGELHPMCSKHPGMLYSRFCIRCSAMVCSDCLQHTHANHDTCDLISGKRIAEGKFREMNCGLMDMIELCQKKLQNFNLSKQKVEASVKVVRNNIHKACNQVINYIETFEKVSKNLTDKVHAAGVKHVNGLVKEANEYEEERVTFEDFCTRYIDSKPGELSAVLPLLQHQLERLTDFYTQFTLVSPNFTVDLKFDPVYPDFNDAMSRLFADLRFEHNVDMESLLNSPLGERAVLEAVQPQPYDMAFKPLSETGYGTGSSSMEPSSGSSVEATSGDDLLQHFIRQTTPCKYIFGKYGRGDYEFSEPSGVCYLHDNSLAVCDAKNHRVVIYDESCSFLKAIGQPANLPPLAPTTNSTENEHVFSRTAEALFFPFRLAQCPVTHNLVIVERPPSTDIQVFSFDGTFLRCFGNDCLRYPRGITVNESGQILVVESRTMKVFIFSMQGVKLHAFYLSMHLEFPNDIAAKGGNIFISDNRTHCVHVYDYNLEWQRQIGHESLTYFPIGVAVNHLGQVVVADNHNTFNITVFSQDGSFVHGFKSQSKHANCYSVALHPRRPELAVTTKECRVVLFDYIIPDRQARGGHTA